MQTGTHTTDSAETPAGRKQIGEYDRKGFTIRTWMSAVDDFDVVISDGDSGAECATFEGDNRGRCERAAEEWIDRQVALTRELAAPEADDAAVANGAEPLVVAGWLLRLGDDASGTYRVELVDARSGKTPRDAGEFRKYMSSDEVVAAARQWAEENPLHIEGKFNGLPFEIERQREEAYSFSVSYPLGTGSQIETYRSTLTHPSPAHATKAAQSWCGAFRIGGELPVDRPIPDAELVEQLPTAAGGGAEGVEAIEVVAAPVVEAPVPAPAPAPAATPVPRPATASTPTTGEPPRGTDWGTVDEVWTLLQQRDELSEQLALLRVRKKKLAGEEKELVEMINEKDLEVRFARQKVPGAQRALPLHQAPRPEMPAAPAPMTQPQLASAAEKAAHEIEGPEVPWAFNGVDHTILVRPHGDGWRAALKGHENKTEVFDPDRSAAIESCRQRASIVFEDAEPGSTAIPDPPKRGRGRRKKDEVEQPPPAEEAADAPRVIAALRLSMNLDEAAKKLKISTKTLQKWAAENGVTLSEHLGVELGKDEPAPEPKTNKKPRGPAPKASKKPRGGRKSK